MQRADGLHRFMIDLSDRHGNGAKSDYVYKTIVLFMSHYLKITDNCTKIYSFTEL